MKIKNFTLVTHSIFPSAPDCCSLQRGKAHKLISLIIWASPMRTMQS